jgi:cobalt-zinc-cadmium efflux system outer membrane protein
MRMLAALRVVATALVCLLSTTAQADTITLEQAVERAAKRPSVQMAEAEVEARRGEAIGARLSTYNPELGIAAGPKFGASRTLLDAEVSLAQTTELGGKRAARRDVASARVRAADAERDVSVREARLDAWRTFQLALVAQERLAVAREAEDLALAVATAAKDSQSLGASTQLQLNLATSEVGRARHERLDAENGYLRACADLAVAVGARAEETLEPSGALALLPEAPATEQDMLARVRRARPELVAVRAERDAAAAEQRLAGAAAVPDLTWGVSYGYEEDIDYTSHAVLFSASVSLPFFNRNQGNRRAARARLHRAELDQTRLLAELEREVTVAVATYRRAQEAVLGFDRDVNDRLHENLELAQQSYQAGKINYFEFNLVRRELVASRLAYLDAVAEAVEAWHALRRAIGEG